VPTYQYSCAACGARPEVQQKMTDDTLTACPACGADGLRKLFTGVGVVFKGSGFYRTDSRGSGSGGSSGSSGSSSSSASTSGSSDSGSAPATGGSDSAGSSTSGGSSSTSGGSSTATPAAAPA
jgi:putative FmdB family regulatory protein